VIDYPEEYVPPDFPPADLILSFPEVAAVAELIPDVVKVTGASAVIAAVDNEASLPVTRSSSRPWNLGSSLTR
jgi:hypothetical protein